MNMPATSGGMEVSEAGIAVTIMSLFVFLTFLGFFLWGLKTGQFRDIEEAKYRIFELPCIPEKESEEPSEVEVAE